MGADPTDEFDELHDDDLEDDDAGAGDQVAPAPAGEPAPELYYPTLEEFVHVYLAATNRRAIDGGNRSWCPQ